LPEERLAALKEGDIGGSNDIRGFARGRRVVPKNWSCHKAGNLPVRTAVSGRETISSAP
jgi:hypothetical protein